MEVNESLLEWLKQAHDSQEPVEIVYMGGSTPGRSRRLLITEVFKYKFHAVDADKPNASTKTYNVESVLRVCDLPPEVVASMDAESDFINQKFVNFEDFAAKIKPFFESKGLRVNSTEDTFEIFSLSKRRKRPVIGLYYSDQVLKDSEELEELGCTMNSFSWEWTCPPGVNMYRKTNKCWLLDCGRRSRYEIFDSIALKFLTKAFEIAKSELGVKYLL